MDRLLQMGLQNGASDIHFRPGDPPTYRVHGVLRQLKYDKLTPAHTKAIALNVVVDPEVAKTIDTLQELDTSYAIQGVGRFRANLYRQRGSLAVVLRAIPSEVPTIDGLGLPPVLKQIASQERGLVLVTGATGSGKSTTMAALVHHVNNNEAVHILTIEDPIEFIHKNIKASISQREIGLDTRGYGPALRSALRQDPDVILIGELRDLETIDIALKAAETGHMVLATVHTTDAAKTIGRLMSVFPAGEQALARSRLAENLKAVVSQRLLPKVDGKSRVLALEIMVQTKTVQEYILDAARTAGHKDVIEKGKTTYGTQSFDQHLTDLYRAGHITLEVAKASATNAADFERALNFE